MLRKILSHTVIFCTAIGLSVAAKGQDSCTAELDTRVDKFEGSKTISTSISDPAYVSKVIQRGVATYYLSLRTTGTTATVHKTGVTVLFSDGTKWSKPTAKIDIETKDDEYEYSAFVTLSPADVLKFSQKTITDFRLYIHDNEIGERNARELRCGTAELLKIKN